MINSFEVRETNKMIEENNLDVRTITMGISLLDCITSEVDKTCDNIYKKILSKAGRLVETGDEIALEFGIPIVNKRVSVTPISLIGAACCNTTGDFVKIAKTLDKAAHEINVNFIGGFSALVSKGMTPAEKLLIESIPEALASTERVCSSVNVGSTKTGIDMDAVKLLGAVAGGADHDRQTARLTVIEQTLGQRGVRKVDDNIAVTLILRKILVDREICVLFGANIKADSDFHAVAAADDIADHTAHTAAAAGKRDF